MNNLKMGMEAACAIAHEALARILSAEDFVSSVNDADDVVGKSVASCGVEFTQTQKAVMLCSYSPLIERIHKEKAGRRRLRGECGLRGCVVDIKARLAGVGESTIRRVEALVRRGERMGDLWVGIVKVHARGFHGEGVASKCAVRRPSVGMAYARGVVARMAEIEACDGERGDAIEFVKGWMRDHGW